MNDLHLVDLVYSAISEPKTGWATVIGAFGELFPEAKTALSTYCDEQVLADQSVTNIEDVAARAYAEHYGAINPVVPPLLQCSAKRYFDADEFVAPDDFLKTEVYNDFWRPLGNLRRNVGVVLENDGRLFSTFCTHYPADRYDDHGDGTPGATIQRLTPHLRRALHLQSKLENARKTSACLLESLGDENLAVFILSPARRIENLNKHAETLLAKQDLVRRSPDERLSLINHRDDEGFQAQLAWAVRLEDMHKNKVELLKTKTGDVYKIQVSPGAPSTRAYQSAAGVPERQAMVRIRLVGPNKPLDPIILRLSLGLSPAEIRLATSLYAGATLQNYAEASGVSVHTARNQLKSIFDKSGTRRQAELTALLSRLN